MAADNTSMMKQIYTLLEDNIFFGDRLSQGEFVALVSPGQFISTSLSPTNMADQHTIWKLANSTIAASFVWKPTMSTVSGIYGDMMEKAALPSDPLTPAAAGRTPKYTNAIGFAEAAI
jgi:hypothetical protein